jgi:hypothetical protein
MPDGVEVKLDVQALADLLAVLKAPAAVAAAMRVSIQSVEVGIGRLRSNRLSNTGKQGLTPRRPV